MSGGNPDFFRDQIWTFISVVVAVILGVAAILVTLAVANKPPNSIINGPQPGITVTVTSQPTSTPIPTLTPTDTPVPVNTPDTTQPLSASQILTNAAMATGVYTNDNPIAYTSNFTVGYYAYLTFQIHSGGQAGYITTIWYLIDV